MTKRKNKAKRSQSVGVFISNCLDNTKKPDNKKGEKTKENVRSKKEKYGEYCYHDEKNVCVTDTIHSVHRAILCRTVIELALINLFNCDQKSRESESVMAPPSASQQSVSNFSKLLNPVQDLGRTLFGFLVGPSSNNECNKIKRTDSLATYRDLSVSSNRDSIVSVNTLGRQRPPGHPACPSVHSTPNVVRRVKKDRPSSQIQPCTSSNPGAFSQQFHDDLPTAPNLVTQPIPLPTCNRRSKRKRKGDLDGKKDTAKISQRLDTELTQDKNRCPEAEAEVGKLPQITKNKLSLATEGEDKDRNYTGKDLNGNSYCDESSKTYLSNVELGEKDCGDRQFHDDSSHKMEGSERNTGRVCEETVLSGCDTSAASLLPTEKFTGVISADKSQIDDKEGYTSNHKMADSPDTAVTPDNQAKADDNFVIPVSTSDNPFPADSGSRNKTVGKVTPISHQSSDSPDAAPPPPPPPPEGYLLESKSVSLNKPVEVSREKALLSQLSTLDDTFASFLKANLSIKVEAPKIKDNIEENRPIEEINPNLEVVKDLQVDDKLQTRLRCDSVNTKGKRVSSSFSFSRDVVGELKLLQPTSDGNKNKEDDSKDTDTTNVNKSCPITPASDVELNHLSAGIKGQIVATSETGSREGQGEKGGCGTPLCHDMTVRTSDTIMGSMHSNNNYQTTQRTNTDSLRNRHLDTVSQEHSERTISSKTVQGVQQDEDGNYDNRSDRIEMRESDGVRPCEAVPDGPKQTLSKSDSGYSGHISGTDETDTCEPTTRKELTVDQALDRYERRLNRNSAPNSIVPTQATMRTKETNKKPRRGRVLSEGTDLSECNDSEMCDSDYEDGVARRARDTRSYNSRRSSTDSSEDGFNQNVRDLKQELKDLEEKFRKTMVANASLDNEKCQLMFQVDLLKDQVEEGEEQSALVLKELRAKTHEHELLKRDHAESVRAVQLLQAALREQQEMLAERGLLLSEGLQEESVQEEEQDRRTRAIVSQETANILNGVGGGPLDVRIKRLAGERDDLQDSLRRLKLDLEEERSKSSLARGAASMEDIERETKKMLDDYKFKISKNEQEIATLTANVARLESQVTRFKTTSETLEASEESLKAERRKTQRELREATARNEELETQNKHLEKRLEKLKTAKSNLLKEL